MTYISPVRTIRFKFAPLKAAAAIHWMVAEQSGIDLHTMLKACYFADKRHLNKHCRPIFGATYKAMKYGPVPLEIYEMAKGESYWLAEIDAEDYPWRLRGYKLHLNANSDPDKDELSESDMKALRKGLEKSASLNFDERTAATHGEDWQAAELGIMLYEDMILPEHREKYIPYLLENARRMRL
jgi:uncharacterized phage-associated protein